MPVYALGDQVPDIHEDAYVHPDAVIIGSVTVGAHSSIWATTVLRGDDGTITVGQRSSIQDGTIVHTTHFNPTVVGNSCTVGHNAHLEGCTLKDKALVGSGSIVLHEAVIGEEAVVGANAFVGNRVEVPPLAMALGTPAKIKENAVEPGWFDLGIQSYVDRAQRYRQQLRRID